ncbi:uncharacterized protein LOC123906683 isoform X2 [Trifolium pratense]|uniref:uncharacterized protein LOC123906683 isoform X2 n=1 Tax=Trifolium pratense TaxID=57577 RepID=UPI001E6903EA|nr:uncharacterized protein LOC123906683 isoform X2 [Trifolium pratense]
MPPRVAPPPPADPSSDPSSPYYVHSSDGPSSVKVTPLLTGANYHSWARSMRRALGAKLKFEFLDGTIPTPADAFDPSYRSWNRCNMLIHSWIMNSVDPSIAQSIVFLENASDVWIDLKERFSQGDLVRVSELQQEIYALTQDSRSEQKSLKMIGSAERKDGLYYLVQTNEGCTSSSQHTSTLSVSANNVSLPDSALWHFSVCKETLETMSESDDEVMHEEVMYEEMIMEIIKVEVNCKKALAIINKSIQESNNQEHQYLLELKARVLWYMKKRDNGVLSALGELFDSGVEFRFPVTYLVYGASSHVKEGSESQLKIYRLGLEQAEKKDDKMVDEFKQRLQPLEEAAHRKLEKSKRKMRRGMNVEKQEEEEVQTPVKDVELQTVVDVTASEQSVLEEKKKNEDEIFPFQFDCHFKFTMVGKLKNQCYTGIQYIGEVEVDKSFVAATKCQLSYFKELYYQCSRHQSLLTVESIVQHPADGTDLLVCEVVQTLNDYFEEQKLDGAEVTETQWWEHISEKFRRIFRDVIQGMMFLYSATDYDCGDLSFNVFVTKSGRGKILPSMVKRTGTKQTVDHIKILKDLMKTVIAFPFSGITESLELPLELRRFLDFEHSRCFSPAWFVINCPFFWTVEERIQFAHELKMLIKLNLKFRYTIEACLEDANLFSNWNDVVDGIYKKILNYHGPTTSNAEDDDADESAAHAKSKGMTLLTFCNKILNTPHVTKFCVNNKLLHRIYRFILIFIPRGP